MALKPCRIRRALLRRRSWQAACRLCVERAGRRWERRSSPAMLRAAHAGRRCGAPFLRLSGARSGCATGDAVAIGIRSPDAAAIPPTCYRSITCYRLPRVAARSRITCSCRALPTTACATATDRHRRRSRRGSDIHAVAAFGIGRPRAPASGRRSLPCESCRFRRSEVRIAATSSSRSSDRLPDQNRSRTCACEPAAGFASARHAAGLQAPPGRRADAFRARRHAKRFLRAPAPGAEDGSSAFSRRYSGRWKTAILVSVISWTAYLGPSLPMPLSLRPP